MWIDISEDRLSDALEFCKDQILNDKRSDLVVLYDSSLPEHLIRQIIQLKTPRTEGGFGWKKIVPWESFVGGECDTVVYVGSGSLEAFSRARLKLMIITVSPREQRGDTLNIFCGYNVGLKNSVEKDLLENKIVESPVDYFPTKSTPVESQTQINPAEIEPMMAGEQSRVEPFTLEEAENNQRR